jgi:serine/threonine-protein kinase
VVADVALGLSAAHSVVDDNGAPLNIVHRDVSPQNIMIGLGGMAKILDFGIAKAEGKLGKTATGLLKGKVAYMSPEQINIKDVDARADVYSLGVCLYQAIVGHLPFRGTNDFEVLRARMGGDFTPASVVRPDLPVALTALIDRALAEDPAERFGSALEFHDALETWLLTEGAADRRALSSWLSELFPDIDALVVGRPVANMGMVSTVPSTLTQTPTSQPSASRGFNTVTSAPEPSSSPGTSSSPSSSSPPGSSSSPGMPLSVVAEPTRETMADAAAPRRFSIRPAVVGGVAALAAGLGVFVVMQRSPPAVVAVPPVPVVAVAPVAAPVPVVAPAIVAPPTPVVPVVDDDAALGSLDDVAAPATTAVAKPKPKPWVKAPPLPLPLPSASSGSASSAVAPPSPPPIETAAAVVSAAVSTVEPAVTSPSTSTPTPAVAEPPAVAVRAPEAPQLPKQKRVLQVKELVAACAEIEAELERRGHVPASRVRNVTAPLARALASKLVDGDAVELPMTSIYWFAARRLTEAGQSPASRSAVAAALVEAHRNNSL